MNIPSSAVRMDINDMRRRLGDDEALIAVLFRLFLEDYAARLESIKSAVNGRRLDDLRREAHMMKGNASNLSAFGVVEAAAALEDSADRGGGADVDHLFAKLVVEVEQLVTELRGLLGRL